MCPDDKDKQWGTIYLDASRESTMEKLDAMQAASRREQMNQRTEQEYLGKVRAKATERAKEILGQAYTERQKVLDEAKQDAEHIRLEMQGQYAFAASERDESQRMLEAAQEELRQAEVIREAARDEGFTAGLEQAQQELEDFRAAMGVSVAGVLAAIHAQCGTIFEGWRQEMAELLKVCVEKGTGLVLDEQYPLVLEQLVMEAVRQLDDRRSITLRVHPDDEGAVADMFAAARERLPNIGQWIVTGDTSLQLGGLIAESQSGTVDSRLELHRELVENILQHLVLPASALDAEADRSVAEAVRQEAEKIALLAPPPLPQEEAVSPTPAPPAEHAEQREQADNLPTQTPEIPPLQAEGDLQTANSLQVDDALLQAELETQTLQQAPTSPPPLESIPSETAYAGPEPEQTAPTQYMPDMPRDDGNEPASVTEPARRAEPTSAVEPVPVAEPATSLIPTRDELEHELFDVPPSPQDEILAQGGFLDTPLGGEHSS